MTGGIKPLCEYFQKIRGEDMGFAE